MVIERERVWSNKRDENGPFDIIGDVHGCAEELDALLTKLGYVFEGEAVTPPEGRRAIFVGDLVDRGPRVADVLRRVMGLVTAGTAVCVPGNHDVRLVRALGGKPTQRTHGLAESLEQLENESPAFRQRVVEFLDGFVSHYVFDEGKLVVAHAGMRADLAGRTSGAVRSFALYGETTGEIDSFGLPVRQDWAAEYRGKALTVYGHTPVSRGDWLNNTVNIDTGCVFGGSLTALRYPEQELVSVEASRVYCEPVKPFLNEETDDDRSAQQVHDAMLDIDDVRGKQIVETRFSHSITIREERAVAALEVMSRYSVDPRWLIYLPPTMAPAKASDAPDYLEHPDEVYSYFQVNGVDRVVCEEKHMGSRASLIVCKDAEAASRRFGVEDGGAGVCYTRTGRRFFEDDDLEAAFLGRVREAVGSAGLWSELETDWVLLDCELMPWSARAQQLLKDQYAAVGAAAAMSIGATVDALETASANGVDVGEWLGDYRDRKTRIDHYVDAYRAYCWPVASLTDLKLAPFHLLATEGRIHHNQSHVWHLDTIARLCAVDPDLLLATSNRSVDLGDEADRQTATEWWLSLTAQGGEGMVVKPLNFITQGARGMVQPAIKCRGREYLRIIYGPDYTTPDHLDQLRRRNVRPKQALALREFSLGMEALERFVRLEPLRRVHQCVFGVLALESEPIDPRL